jgi:hypothetical protein
MMSHGSNPQSPPADNLAYHVEALDHATAERRAALPQGARRFSFFSGIAVPVIAITLRCQRLM